MDEREGISMSGSASFYMPQGFSGGWQQELQGPQGMRAFNSPNTSLPMQISDDSGGPLSSGMQGKTQSSISPNVGVNMGSQGGPAMGEPVKKKRGRPRKYGPDGTVALGLSSSMLPPDPESEGGIVSISGSGSAMLNQKRSRGRPPGTGKKQQLASYGEWASSSAGMGFVPHTMIISVGEDIASKILSFSQLKPRAICILSATGAVSTVTLCQSATSGGTVSHKGRFDIISLNGSYLLTDDVGSHSRTGGISVSLCNEDGRIIGGRVGGVLIAASQVQVMVGSFLFGGSKPKNKNQSDAEQQHPAEGEKQATPPNAEQQPLPLNQSYNPILSNWPLSRPTDNRNSHADIDLSCG